MSHWKYLFCLFSFSHILDLVPHRQEFPLEGSGLKRLVKFPVSALKVTVAFTTYLWWGPGSGVPFPQSL